MKEISKGIATLAVWGCVAYTGGVDPLAGMIMAFPALFATSIIWS